MRTFFISCVLLLPALPAAQAAAPPTPSIDAYGDPLPQGAAARAQYRRGGASVDDESQIVRLGRELVQAQLALAPESFVLHARNADRDLHRGENG